MLEETNEEKNNPDEFSLQAETQSGSDSAERLPSRLIRYGKAKSRAVEMQAFLRMTDENKDLAALLGSCGNWLLFNHYYTVDKVRLEGASFCKKHLVCPLCAIRRGAKQLQAYLTRFQVITASNGPLRAFMVTLTVKNGPDLTERITHLQRGLKLLNQRRRNAKRNNGACSEWSNVLGLVGTYEVTRNSTTGEWHPHCHIIVLTDFSHEIDEALLAHEWFNITGDSFVVDVRPLKHPDDPAQDFVEVFKYAIKFSELSVQDNLDAYYVLSHKRLIFSAGLFFGVKIPESLLDDPLEGLPYISLFYRYIDGSGYNYLPKSECV